MAQYLSQNAYGSKNSHESMPSAALNCGNPLLTNSKDTSDDDNHLDDITGNDDDDLMMLSTDDDVIMRSKDDDVMMASNGCENEDNIPMPCGMNQFVYTNNFRVEVSLLQMLINMNAPLYAFDHIAKWAKDAHSTHMTLCQSSPHMRVKCPG